jgi:hypothetical protein
VQFRGVKIFASFLGVFTYVIIQSASTNITTGEPLKDFHEMMLENIMDLSGNFKFSSVSTALEIVFNKFRVVFLCIPRV